MACTKCARWNLVDPEDVAPVIDECKVVFANASQRDVHAGIGHAREGSLEITYLNCDSYPESMLARHTARMERRASKTNVVGQVARAGTLMTIGGGVVLVGGATGAAMGVAVCVSALMAIRTVNRGRSVVIKLADGGVLAVSRADAWRARIKADGANWLLQLAAGRVQLALRGQDAWSALAQIIPLMQLLPTSAAIVAARQQLALITNANDYARDLSSRQHTDARGFSAWWNIGPHRGTIAALRPEQLLCLEMIATESHEQRLLSGVNASVHREWTEAALIAGIVEELDD